MQLREDYPEESDPEAKALQDYEAFGEKYVAEFKAMRPKKLNEYQQNILNLFYKCRSYSDENKTIPFKIIKLFSDCNFCEKDIAEYIINGIDNEFLKLCSDKIKRDLENLKNKGRQ